MLKTKCNCGCGLDIDDNFKKLIMYLNAVFATKYSKDLQITSAKRCDKQNNKVGGVLHSAHLLGLAVDVAYTSTEDRTNIITEAYVLGFRRIFIYKKQHFIHMDKGTLDQGFKQNIMCFME